MKYLFNILLVLLIGSTGVRAAYTPQSVPHPRRADATAFVSNPDAILLPGEVDAIQRVAQQLHQATGVELVTVALDDIGYADAFEFSVELFNHWGIGDREKKNGVLILFAVQSRDIRITTGGGVEGLLPDAICSRILDEQMIPLLSEGRYGEGLLAGNKAIAARLTNQQALEELLLGYKRKPVTENPWLTMSIFSLLIALLAFVRYKSAPQCPNCKQKGVKVRSELVERATYSHEGRGIKHYTCPYCGHLWNTPYVIPKVPRPTTTYHGRGGGYVGGGGFSGGSFGGGSTFGGGAGGKF